MFDMAEFIKTNLIEGYHNGSFTMQQVNIFAMNYLMKAMISQEDFDYIMNAINPQEEPEEED